ncbi:MAG: metallophosphoesterase, partial [Thermoanaerobaculia bacterium]
MRYRQSIPLPAILVLLVLTGPGLIAAKPAPDQVSQYEWTEVTRVVAIGDLHGSYEKALRILKAAGLIDDDLRWIGGEEHLVITGDVLDRGTGGRELMDLIRRLQDEAQAAGGCVHMLLGNHEAMNLMRDLRYVNPEAYQAFAEEEKKADRRAALKSYLASRPKNANREVATNEFEEKYPPGYFARQQSLNPDGEYGQWLLGLPAIVKINDVIYMHGGLTEEIAELGVDETNRRLQSDLRGHLESRGVLERKGIIAPWMEYVDILWVRQQGREQADELSEDLRLAVGGLVGTADSLMLGERGPLWYRGGSHEDERIERDSLERTLELMSVRAIVVAHSPTAGREITSRFQNRLFRIDHDISSSEALQALVVEGDDIMVLDASTGRAIEAPMELPIGKLDPLAAEVWSDGDLESFLAQAEIVASRDLGRGSTRPRLLEMELEGKKQRGIFKNVSIDGESGSAGQADRYEHEVAAYRLDRMLELGLVPVCVLRELDGEQGSLQVWVEDAVDQESATVYELELFERDWVKARIAEGVFFDALIGNSDRGADDILCPVAGDKLFLVDHSKAFSTSKDIGW